MDQRFSKVLNDTIILTQANLKARYRNSIFGYLWVILAPLATFSAQAYVFNFIFHFQVSNYLQFLLLGTIPWLFFSQSLDMSVGIIFNNAQILKSMPIHPLSFVAAQIADNLVNSLVSLCILLILISTIEPVNWSLLLYLPLPYLSLALFTVSVAFLFSCIQVFFHDLRFILNFSLGLLFFLLPIIYPESFVPAAAVPILKYNILVYIFRPFKDLLLLEGSDFYSNLLISFCISIAAFLFAFQFWKKNRDGIYVRI